MKPVLWWGLALACGSALAVSWLPEAEPTVAAPSATAVVPPRASKLPLAARASAPIPASAAPTPRQAWPALDNAALSAWAPPLPPPRAAAPASAPPLPPPPPFPYQWLGQMHEGPVVRLFLAGPQQTVAVQAGDVLDGRWRVEGADGGRLRLTWLATGETVLVSPRGSNPTKPDPS